MLKNYVLQVREFREITLFDEAGATSSPPAASASRASRFPKNDGLIIDGVDDVADPRRRGSAADRQRSRST